VSMADGKHRRQVHGRLFYRQSGRNGAQSNVRIALLKVECAASFHRHPDLYGGTLDWKQKTRHEPQMF